MNDRPSRFARCRTTYRLAQVYFLPFSPLLSSTSIALSVDASGLLDELDPSPNSDSSPLSGRSCLSERFRKPAAAYVC